MHHIADHKLELVIPRVFLTTKATHTTPNKKPPPLSTHTHTLTPQHTRLNKNKTNKQANKQTKNATFPDQRTD